jgi:hypothetical protein
MMGALNNSSSLTKPNAFGRVAESPTECRGRLRPDEKVQLAAERVRRDRKSAEGLAFLPAPNCRAVSGQYQSPTPAFPG